MLISWQYLQYAHARLCSITRKAGLSEADIATADLSLLTEPMAVNLVRVVCQWPDVVSNTLRTLEPTTILTYAPCTLLASASCTPQG